MKISGSTLLIVALTAIVIYSSFTYLDKKLESEGSATYSVDENGSEKPLMIKKKQAPATDKEEDEKIIQTVEAYQKGYHEGCKENAPESIDSNKSTSLSRAYLLGFQKGKKFCTAKRKHQKEQFEKAKQEGCQSASGTIIRDDTLYSQNGNYQKAWDIGYRQCKKAKEKEKKKQSVPTEKPKTTTQTPAAQINQESPAYRKGYRQGCDVSRGGYQKRDEQSYLHSRDYRAGWTRGRNECKTEKTTSREQPAERTREPNYFDQGYNDGCDTATRYFRRDRYKYKHFRSYREGWKTGEYECSRRDAFPPPPILLDPFGF